MDNFEASNKADWIVQISGTDDGDDIDFTGADITVAVKDSQGCLKLEATVDNGKITLPSTTVVQVHFTPDDMAKLCPASYAIGGVYKLNNETNQLFVGSFNVYDGIASI